MEDLELLTRVISILIGVFCIYSIIRSITKPNYIIPIFFVFLFFFWTPLVLDTFVGVADYSFKFNILNRVVRNDIVGVYYNCYVSYLMLLFLYFSYKPIFKVNLDDIKDILNSLYNVRYYLYFICLLPIFFIFLVDNPLNYLFYRSLNSSYEIQDGFFDRILVTTTVVVCITGSVLLYIESNLGIKKTRLLRSMFVICLLLLAVVINGKRNVVPIILIIYFSLLYFSGIQSIWRMVRFGLFSSILIYVFISFYGKYSNTIGAENYARNRIDFGRLEVTKFVIYNEIVLNESILEFKGQSFLFSMFFYVPRSLWENKPQPYAVYMTKELLNMRTAEYLGWSMTTSIFEESISNLGFWVALLFPFIYFFILKKVINLPAIFRILGFFLMIMLVVVQFSAVSPLLVGGVFCFLLFKFKKRIG